MPNNWIIAEVERLAALAWPDCDRIQAGGSTRYGRQVGWQLNGEGPGDGRGKKWVTGCRANGDRRTLASGDSYRRIRDDLEKLLDSRGIDHNPHTRGVAR